MGTVAPVSPCLRLLLGGLCLPFWTQVLLPPSPCPPQAPVLFFLFFFTPSSGCRGVAVSFPDPRRPPARGPVASECGGCLSSFVGVGSSPGHFRRALALHGKIKAAVLRNDRATSKYAKVEGGGGPSTIRPCFPLKKHFSVPVTRICDLTDTV